MENITALVPYTIPDLQAEYGLKSRQAVYDRLKILNISSIKQGTQSLMRASDKQALDELHHYLQTPGRSLSGFVEEKGIAAATPEADNGHITTQTASSTASAPTTLEAIQALAQALRPPVAPLEHYRALLFAVENELILTSAEVKALIGIKPSSESFTRGRFTFTRAGKIGNQSAWLISKVSLEK